LVAGVTLSIVLAIACDETPTAPSSGSVVTFAVGSETFRVALTAADQIAAARAAQSGGREKISTGRIVAGTQVNTGWTWHLEGVTFAEVTIELREAEVASRYQSLMDNSTRDGHL